MSLIIPANTLASGGYAVDNSLRFNDGSTDYLSKTFTGTQTDAKKCTISCWWKRSSIGNTGINGGEQTIISWNTGLGNRSFLRSDGGTDQLYLGIVNSSGDYKLQITPVQRDISAWYHIVAHVDTTQSTASNRMKMYINGVEITNFDNTNYIPQDNTDIGFGEAEACNIGRDVKDSNTPLDGYLAEMVFIDGQALDPTSFGEFDEDSGIWKPIDVSGLTYGTNGFYLDFEDSGALGDDVSGNGNDFTVNNLTAIDQTTDTPTNNFATYNSLFHKSSAYTFAEGNLQVSATSTASSWITRWGLSNIGFSSGKWYAEVKISDYGSGQFYPIGIVRDEDIAGIDSSLGSDGWGYYPLASGGGEIIGVNMSNQENVGTATTGDIIGLAVDADNRTLQFYKNGSTLGSQVTNVTAGTYFFASNGYANHSVQANFGNPTFTGTDQSDGNSRGSFEYAPPSGYLSLCTANLSEVLG